MQAEQSLTQQKQVSVSVFSGAVIVAGSAVGAGMFSLPTVSAGMWFGWSLACMLVSWFALYQVSLLILEVNLNFNRGDSFDTMVKGTLGKRWGLANGLMLSFLLYILQYAYISGGGSIVNQTLESTIGYAPPQMLSGFIFAFVLSFVVWLSTRAVDRVVSILIVAMVISFTMAVFNLTFTADLSQLIVMPKGNEVSPFFYIFAALPFYLTSFGFHCNVPSLVKYYGKQPKLIAKSMLLGSSLCFVIYLLWLVATMGNLDQAGFVSIIEQGGNIGELVNAINLAANVDNLGGILSIFANLAIVSSFLGVSLSMFDFIADRFSFADDATGRLKTALVTFVPPTIGGLIFPHGFITAIGFAGLVVALNALIIPPMMVIKSRQLFPDSQYTKTDGNKMAYLIMVLGVLYAICHVLSMMSFLPVLGGSVGH